MDTFTALADLVDQHYVIAGHATDHAARIHEHAAELEALLPDIDAVNARLHELVPDRHLGLRRDPGGRPPAPTAGGVGRVMRLDGGVGLVALEPVFAGPDVALPHLRAAAGLVADAAALVLDLRRCGGGDTDTAALVHGWLLGPDPVRIGRFEHRGAPSTDYASDPAIGVHLDVPVRVLTSRRTFSGGEDLAYVLQALGRARVVGERTGGGAHPVEHFALPHGRVCQIPVARTVVDATGSSWEGEGVVPDIGCPAAGALTVACAELGHPQQTGSE